MGENWSARRKITWPISAELGISHVPERGSNHSGERSNTKQFTVWYQHSCNAMTYCMARQCSPLRRKFMECYIIKPAQSLLMRHLVIGQRQKAPNFSAFHWSPHCCLITIGLHFVTTRVVHLPKRTETSLITASVRFGNWACFGPNHRIGPGCAGRA